LEALKPRDLQSLAHFRQIMRPALQQALAAEYPNLQDVLSMSTDPPKRGTAQPIILSRRKKGDRVPAVVGRGTKISDTDYLASGVPFALNFSSAHLMTQAMGKPANLRGNECTPLY